jgi:SAM-dependent methyltransferase
VNETGGPGHGGAKPSPEGNRFVPALGFAALTPLYDAVIAATMRESTFRRALLAQAAIADGHRVLDLGSGSGTLAILIGREVPGARVEGLDADAAMVDTARRKAALAGSSAVFHHGDATRLPFADATFNRVVSSLFFHHLSPEGKRQAAAEIARVLRPGGELHAADWGPAPNPVMRALFLLVQLLDGFENTRENVEGRLPGIFAAAGLGDVAARSTIPSAFGVLALLQARRPGA